MAQDARRERGPLGAAGGEPKPAGESLLARVAVVLLGIALVSAALALAGCPSPRPADASAGARAADAPECSGDTCTRFGIAGECVRGRCVLGAGACTRDRDCDDRNVCTTETCDRGTCRVESRAGACVTANDAPGVCEAGFCEWDGSPVCDGDADCPQPENPCLAAACEGGACVRGPREEGAACSSPIGRDGVCAAGACTFEGDANETRCRTRYTYWGPERSCTGGLQFVLEEEALRKAEEDISKGLAALGNYDMKASLVALPGGGYNILVHNRRDRTDIRGLCDPSIVAWSVADYTSGTNWRSGVLHIWLDPYAEGWGIATQGSRKAVARGRAAGTFGAINVPTFRAWLERSFHPLEPAQEGEG